MKYSIKCQECGAVFSEKENIIKCPNGCSGLLQSDYQEKTLVLSSFPSLWKFFNWLPLLELDKRILSQTSAFEVYQSRGLAQKLGLKNLFICRNTCKQGSQFSMKTDTFKDIEAQTALQRILQTNAKGKPLLICSDGNVANSFIYYADIFQYPTVVVVPEEARENRLWSYAEKTPFVVLVSLGKSDYYEAIVLSEALTKTGELAIEGGSRNIARRDGVGTILLEASLLIGKMPEHYFQALGSGPGAVSVFEGAQRLIKDGRFGDYLPKIQASQNYPFAPMYEAWQRNSREISPDFQNEQAKQLIAQVKAQVLTNRFPIYNIKGGVFDVLQASNGFFYSISNQEIEKAQEIFKASEGYGIGFESAVAVGSLWQAVGKGNLKKDETILLNITNGDKSGIKKQRYPVKADVAVSRDYNIEDVWQRIEQQLKKCV